MTLMNQSAQDGVLSRTDFPVAPNTTLPPEAGLRLGISEKYQQLSRIGAGGTCEVFRAWDPSIGAFVALKRLGSYRTNRTTDRNRLKVEFDLLHSLRHCAVPAAFEYFPEPLFKPYFSMQLVHGVDLCRVLSGLRRGVKSMQKMFPLEELVNVVAKVADALRHAHAKSTIHRDMKPENIMLAESGHAAVVDWGSAGQPNLSAGSQANAPADEVAAGDLLTEKRNERRAKDESSAFEGSPLYSPPERIHGASPADELTDVFGLGAVLYDCLALRPLIRGNSLSEVLAYACRGQYDRPSQVSDRDFIPQPLEEICIWATCPNPEDRLPNMQTFLDCLMSAGAVIEF